MGLQTLAPALGHMIGHQRKGVPLRRVCPLTHRYNSRRQILNTFRSSIIFYYKKTNKKKTVGNSLMKIIRDWSQKVTINNVFELNV